MRRRPRNPRETLLSPQLLWRVGFVSVLFVAGVFGIFFYAIDRGYSVALARTMVVNTIVVMEIFYLFSVRYRHGSALTLQGVLGTPAVLISVGIAVAAQFAFTYIPAMQSVFGTEKVAPADGALIIVIGVTLLLIVELEKRLVAWWAGPAQS
jgi:magnesium-transporting ATPase (P-type)